jgi:prepilin-type processing-associated H-X9-DG protein
MWQTYAKLSAMVRPGPSGLFVIADENPTSINDPTFLMAMGTIADVNGNATSTQFIDTPGSYHNGAGTFAFADGRVETHRWIGSRIKLGGNNYPSGDSLNDLRWLQQRTTAVK